MVDDILVTISVECISQECDDEIYFYVSLIIYTALSTQLLNTGMYLFVFVHMFTTCVDTQRTSIKGSRLVQLRKALC